VCPHRRRSTGRRVAERPVRLTIVRQGTVAVRDFTLDQTVLVDAGELAQAP
jgi:hypothetical protein